MAVPAVERSAEPVRYNPAVVTLARGRASDPVDAVQIDITLMNRLVARDAGAVGDLYDRHSRLLYGLILRILGQRSDAEEVLQEVFLSVWNNCQTYNAELGAPVAWLVRIARNRALDRLRANAVRTRTAESAEAPAPVQSPEAHAALTEQQRAVTRALDTLPLEQRELIEQAYFLGLTQSELAERHHLPLGTVKTRIRTGMLTLRQCLAEMQIAQ